MKIGKQLRDTRLNELVETHNLALSLKRLEEASPHDTERWKRALYHAVCMQRVGDFQFRTRLRDALGLP